MCNAYIPRKSRLDMYAELWNKCVPLSNSPRLEWSHREKRSRSRPSQLPVWYVYKDHEEGENRRFGYLLEYQASISLSVIPKYCILSPNTYCRRLELDQRIHSIHNVGLQEPISDGDGVHRIYTYPPMSLCGVAEKLPWRRGSLDGKSNRLQLLYKWRMGAWDWLGAAYHLALYTCTHRRNRQQWSPWFLFHPRHGLLPGNTGNARPRHRSHAQRNWMFEPHDSILIWPDTNLAEGDHLRPRPGVDTRNQRWFPRIQNDKPSHGRDVLYRSWGDGRRHPRTSMDDSLPARRPGLIWIFVFHGESHITIWRSYPPT